MAKSEDWGPFDLRGRGVCVTGGGGHLGSAIAVMLSSAGATVAIIGRSHDKLDAVARQAARGKIIPVPGDIAKEEDLQAVIECLEGDVGAVHGWVNNAYAATASPGMSFSRSDVASSLNSLADLMIATQHAEVSMRRGGVAGSIVNIASIYGMVSPQPAVYDGRHEWHNPAAYGALKAGVIQFTRYASVHLAPHGIRVNCITPGAFPGNDVQKDREFISRLSERTPMARVGRPEEVAGAVLYMLSDAASFTTGSNLVVDGGWCSW